MASISLNNKRVLYKNTTLNNNDTLNENELVSEEKEIERIIEELNNFEKGGTQAILNKIDTNLYKMANVTAKPQVKSKGKKIKVTNPTKATQPKAVVSKAVVNPVFQTVQTFEDKY